MAIRLLCLNAWGGRLFDPLIAFIREIDADIICLQEVTQAVRPGPARLAFLEGALPLPQQADLFGDISRILPHHRAQFFPAMQGVLFDDGDRPHQSRFGLATYVRHSLPIMAQADEFVHGAFRADGWGQPPVPRNMHCFRLYDSSANKAFTLGHLHGLRDVAGKHDTPERQQQVKRIIKVLDQVYTPGDPLVLCGDLNLLPDSSTFEALRNLGLVDLVVGRGYSDTRTSWYEKPQRFADYMLTSANVEIAGFDVLTAPEVSDHRALLLEFT